MTGSSRLRREGWLPAWTKQWARDSALLLFSQFSAVVATSLLAIILARNLGPSDWGVFSGFLGLSLALSIVVNFGVGGWLLRELSRLWTLDHAATHEAAMRAGYLVTGAVILNLGVGLALVVVTLVVTLLIRVEAGAIFALVSLMAYGALSAASAGLEAFFRSRRQLRVIVGAVLVEKVLLLSLVGGAIISGLGIAGISVMYVVAGIARVVFNGAKIRSSDYVVMTSPSRVSLGETIRASMPFALNAASLNIIPRLDTFILVTLSATAAGYFALGDRVLSPALMIPWVMSSALYPFLAREGERSRAGWKILGVFIGGGTLLSAAGVTLAPSLVPLIFGSAYAEAVEVIQVMLIAIPFVYGSNLMLAQLYTSGRERSVLGATLASSALGTVTIVAGQVAIGPTGAAGGYLLRQVLFLTGLTFVGAVWARQVDRRSQSAAAAGRRSRGAEEGSGSIPTL